MDKERGREDPAPGWFYFLMAAGVAFPVPVEVSVVMLPSEKETLQIL